jgi:hypothetical protein
MDTNNIFNIKDEYLFTKIFLKNVYNINNYDDFINFLKINKNLNKDTMCFLCEMFNFQFLNEELHPEDIFLKTVVESVAEKYDVKIPESYFKSKILSIKHKLNTVNFIEKCVNEFIDKKK